MTEPTRRFTEPPPVDYSNVPAVMKWVVQAIIHLDSCFDSRLSSIEDANHDFSVRLGVVKSQVRGVIAGFGTAGAAIAIVRFLGLA